MTHLELTKTPATEIPLLNSPVEYITRARLSYKVGGIKAFDLPADMTPEKAASCVSGSLLKGKTVVVDAAPGLDITPAERTALTWILGARCEADSNGKEWRAICPLGPKAAPAFAQVILKYDKDFNATATLVGRGQALGGPAEQVSDDEIKRRLAGYGLAEITGDWKAGELLKVYRALALLTDPERAALAGVGLERVQALPSADKAAHTAADFFSALEPETGGMGKIRVADTAYADDAKGFYGGTDGTPTRPPSFQNILHEVGHAIDTQVRRARSRQNAELALASTGNTQKFSPGETIPHDAILNAKKLPFTNFDKEIAVTDLANSAFEAVSGRKENADALIAECRAKGGIMATFATNLGTFKDNRDSGPAKNQYAVIKREQDTIGSVFQLIGKLIGSLNSNAVRVNASNFDTIQNELQGLDHDPWASFYREVMRWSGIQKRAAEWRADYKRGGEVTGRQKKFEAYVEQHNIQSDLTTYSKASWPDSPDELYCEAFSVWKLDPTALGQHSEALADYFRKGLHFDGN